MLKSFAANLLSAFAMAYFIRLGNAWNLITGMKFGMVGGCGITLASQVLVANWQGTKTTVLVH